MPVIQRGDTSQMTVQSDILLCLGFGYTAERLAHLLLAQGWSLFGTSRSQQKAHEISSLHPNAQGLVFNEETQPQLPHGAHLLISAPPDDDGCPAFRAVFEQVQRAPTITYLSTTGVYGDHNGGWVYEDTPVSPGSDRARRRVIAEQQWASLKANIVRLPGIYGPGRSAFDRLRAGTARRIIKPGQVFSRIHVDDIASGLQAILKQTVQNSVLHLCDDEPAPPQDVIAYAAKLIGVEVPQGVPFSEANLSPMARSFYADCKRVSNAATKDLLGWSLRYPTYREGLKAILEAEGST